MSLVDREQIKFFHLHTFWGFGANGVLNAPRFAHSCPSQRRFGCQKLTCGHIEERFFVAPAFPDKMHHIQCQITNLVGF